MRAYGPAILHILKRRSQSPSLPNADLPWRLLRGILLWPHTSELPSGGWGIGSGEVLTMQVPRPVQVQQKWEGHGVQRKYVNTRKIKHA